MEIAFRPIPPHCLSDLIGKISMLHPLAEAIDEVRGLNSENTRKIREYQLMREDYRFIFIDMEPEFYANEWHYWVAEIGWGYKLNNTNWWLYSLPQLIICQ